jgi:GGDEF domain-containing protein
VIRALASDADLARLESGGALEQLVSRAGDLPGVQDAAAASATIDALQGVIWATLRDELTSPEPEQVSELAQRLALVIEQVRSAALRRLARPERPDRPLTAVGGRPPEREPYKPSGAAAEAGREVTSQPPDKPGYDPAGPSGAAEGQGPEAAPRSEQSSEVRPEALWIGAFEEEIARAEHSGAPLSLLLVEMEDGDRVRAIESPALASTTLGRFAQAVRDAVRRPDLIASESDARAWVIARETGRSGAQALASRLGVSVRSAEPWRGAPMTVTIGIGVLGEDGRDAETLIAAAEESRFAAAASGVDVVRAGFGGAEPAGAYEGSGPEGG